MKIVLKSLATLVVLLLLVLAAGWFYMDRIVHQAILRIGPQVTGTSVELAEVSLQPMAGEVGLRGFNLGNPEGFAAPYILSLDGIDLSVDMSTLREPVLVIDSLVIEAPRINYEATPERDNLRTLQSNIARNTRAGEGNEEAGAEEGSGRKIIIEHLSIQSGQITLSHYMLADQIVEVPLPPLEMTGIGRNSGGATVAEAAAQILNYLSQQAYQQVLTSDRLQRLLDDMEGQLQQRLQEQLQQLEGEEGQMEEVGDQVRGLLDSLRR